MQLAQMVKKAVITAHQPSDAGMTGRGKVALVPKYHTMRSYH
jgi:hypothetical protein